MLVLYHGLIALPTQKLISSSFFEGVNDTFLILKDEVKETALLQAFRKDIDELTANTPNSIREIRSGIEKLVKSCTVILSGIKPDPRNEIYFWASSLSSQCTNALDDLNEMIPEIMQSDCPSAFPIFLYSKTCQDERIV